MTTRTHAPDLDQLTRDNARIAEQHAASERALADAQAKAAQAEADKRAHDARVELTYSQSKIDYKGLREQVAEAEAGFIDAVRQDRDVIGAWKRYRLAVAVGTALYKRNGQVINDHARAERQRRVDQLRQLNQRAKDLQYEHRAITTNPGPTAEPGSGTMLAATQPAKPRRSFGEWQQAARQWQREAAAFRGNDPDRIPAGQLTRMPEPITEYGPEIGNFPDLPSGPKVVPNPLSSAWRTFNEALEAAMTVIEAEAVEKAQQERATEIAKLQQTA